MQKIVGWREKFGGKGGFTLIELMVVISIIGILAALGAVSYTTAQQKTRDAKRRADMKAVQNAFEQYYQTNGQYTSTTNCSPILGTDEVLPGGAPDDPKPSPHPRYTYSCSVDGYCACALMEGGGGNSAANCSFGSDTTHFCVTNLQ